MTILNCLVTFIVCYLLGSLSAGRIFAQIKRTDVNLDDVELPVSGADQKFKVTSVGGNTVSMKFGARVGCLTSLLDAVKVFIPTLVVLLLFPGQYYFLIAAVAGFTGHCWPIYYHFKGGRGISAYYGGLFAFDPVGALVVAFTSLILGMTVLRNVKIANVMAIYTGGVLLIIPWMWLTKSDPIYILYAITINVLFFLAMIPDIRQIVQLIKKNGFQNLDIGMDEFAMGKSMNKMMDRMSIFKKRTTTEK